MIIFFKYKVSILFLILKNVCRVKLLALKTPLKELKLCGYF